MNMIALFEEDFIKGFEKVRLSGRRLEHILNICRAKPGQRLKVGAINGKVGTGTVAEISNEALEMDIILDADPPKPIPLTIVMALPRPLILKRVLFSAASMGVKRIFLINSSRVEKSFWKSHALRDEEINEQLILGLEQARDTMLPEVFQRPMFKPFVEDELPDVMKGSVGLIAHPEAKDPIQQLPGSAVTLAIGPEGGFIPFEVEMFERAGFKAVNLGERILRVDTAVPALISRLF